MRIEQTAMPVIQQGRGILERIGQTHPAGRGVANKVQAVKTFWQISPIQGLATETETPEFFMDSSTLSLVSIHEAAGSLSP